MSFRGEFVCFDHQKNKELVVPNTVIQLGQTRLMQAAMQGNSIAIFNLGVIDEVPSYTDNVADLTTEPTSAGGYARQAINGDAVDWTITSVNGEARVESKTVTFTASGADFSRAFSRFFLMENGGNLIACSSPLPNAVLLLDGQSYSIRYRLYYK